MKQAKYRAIVVLVLLTSLVLTIYPSNLVAQEPVVFRQPANEPTGLDPAQGGFGYQEFFSLYEPLVDAYSSGEITPLAAESWTISDDGLTYTFKLREGLMWSDGQPVTAEDYRQSFLRQLNPATAAYSAQEFFPIRNGQAYNLGEIADPEQVGLSAPDELTLVIELEQPTPYFLSYLGNSNYLPVRTDLIEQYGDQWMEAGNHVGNGPYMLVEWVTISAWCSSKTRTTTASGKTTGLWIALSTSSWRMLGTRLSQLLRQVRWMLRLRPRAN
ncbi:MAG: hypothetical protein IPK19_03955 [Chloroflexi bacterium]|nr:hypothetical protein [Chloroflexota bacterium]